VLTPTVCIEWEPTENSVTEIQIQATSDQLVPGETTRIPILLKLDKAIKVRGIHAKFHGAEETSATYTTYNAATKTTETKTAVQHVDIVKTESILSGRERKGFFGNLTDGMATMLGGGEHDLLEPGEYPFEIEVQVPPDARASLDGKKCRVFYELSVHIDIPVARDVKAVHSFQVSDASKQQHDSPGSVRIRYPEDQGRGFFDALMGPELRVEAALAEGLLHEGDTAEGMLVGDTPKALQYRAINVRLIAVEKTTANEHTDSYTHQGEPVQIAANGEIEGHYSQEFRLPVASPGATTMQGELFSIDCFVQIEFDVPWAKDPKIRIPITLA
jgi:hypothetical protein